MANGDRLVKAGAIGAIIAALCCFTPLLVILLAAVGLTAFSGYLDAVLFSALAICVAILICGLILQHRARAACCPQDHRQSEGPR
ncbi:MAG: mercury resistance system transport protein MerF [Nitrospirota bacterium]